MTRKALKEARRKYDEGEYTLDEWMRVADETYEQASQRTARGSEGTYTVRDLADKEDMAAPGWIIADDPAPADIGRVAFFYSKRGKRLLPIFRSRKLADVYLYRLRKKGLPLTDSCLAALPASPGERANLLRRIQMDLAWCKCRGADDFSTAYNSITYYAYHLEDQVRQILNPGTFGESGLYYGMEGKRVEWDVAYPITPEALARRDREEEERQKRDRDRRVREFYAQEGCWWSVEDEQQGYQLAQHLTQARGALEAVWMTEDGKYRTLTHTGQKLDAIRAGRLITTQAVREGLVLDTTAVSAEKAAGILAVHSLTAARLSAPRVLVQGARFPF
jgi:hypothetical protein